MTKKFFKKKGTGKISCTQAHHFTVREKSPVLMFTQLQRMGKNYSRKNRIRKNLLYPHSHHFFF
jgi:hypothetical protein